MSNQNQHMAKSPLLALAVACLLSHPAAGDLPPGNLIVNGSFENGFAGWAGTLGLYNTPNPVSGATVGVIDDIWSSSVNQCMSQTFATTPGLTYRIAFGIRLPELFQIAPGIWVPVLGDSSGSSTTIDLRWNNQSVRSIPVTLRDWTFYSTDVVATAPSSMITFYNGAGSRAWPFVDDVSVVVVPEPATDALLLAGLGAACLLRQKLPGPRCLPSGRMGGKKVVLAGFANQSRQPTPVVRLAARRASSARRA
jgi:hypothetical protein